MFPEFYILKRLYANSLKLNLIILIYQLCISAIRTTCN